MKNRGVLLAIALGLALRLLVAVWNGFFGPSFGAETDAQEFHARAIDLLRHGDAADFSFGSIYVHFLAAVYAVTGESIFVGSVLSCAAWLGSALLMAGIWRQMQLDRRWMVAVFLVYALLPPSILYTGVTLREAWQLLFVNMATYATLKLLRRVRAADLLLFALAAVGMGLLHGVFTGFAAGLAALTLLLRGERQQGAARPRRVNLAARFGGLALALGLTVAGATLIFPALQAELVESLLQTQQGYLLTDARAQYRTEFDFDSLPAILAYVPYALLQYLFEPFPWRGLAMVDTGLVLENLLRGLLVFTILRGMTAARRQHGNAALLVALAWLLLEAIWAPGTVNWGTAARHHVPSMGLLLLAAAGCRQASLRGRWRAPQPSGPSEPQPHLCPSS